MITRRAPTLALTVATTAGLLLAATALQYAEAKPDGETAMTPVAPKQALEALFAEYWEKGLENSPTRATYLGDHRWDDRLSDESYEAQEARVVSAALFLDRVEAIKDDALTEDDLLSKRIFQRILEERIEGARFEPWLIPITQQSGIHIGFPQLVNSHPFREERDYWNFAARLVAFGRQVPSIIERMQLGIDSMIVPPRVTVEAVVQQIEALIVDDVESHPLYGPLNDKPWPEEMSEADRERVRRAVRAALRDAVIPAYERLRDYVRDTYLEACRKTVGMSDIPSGDGEARYAFRCKRYTTTSRTPDEIHQIGLREVKRIRGEMEDVKEKVGFEGTLGEFFHHLRTQPRFYCETPEALEAGYREVLQRANAFLPKLFGRLPKALCDLRRIEEYREKSAPTAYYYSPPLDGSRPGYFYYNAFDLKSRPRFDMEALTYHEAVPGHHLQICIAQELEGLPEFRKHAGFTVFVEGWALYSEALAKEVGGYDDPYSDFGRLTYEQWRACRLVVDTGLHAKGWSRQQAIDYFKENTGLTETNIVSEVERYIAWPGQALAYKTGQMAILDLRREAEQALGERFDIRRFHDHLLGAGSLPLDILRQRMARWLEHERGR